MKNFISKNWKNIFLIIGAIFLALDLIFIITTPATIPEDFLKYGPDIESDIFDSVGNISEDLSDVGASGETEGIINNVSQNTGMSPDLARNLLVFGFVFIILLVLASIVDNDSSDKKKK